MNLTAKRIGEFKVNGEIGVGDPCYARPDCLVLDAVSGPWAGYVMLRDEGNGRTSVAELIAVCQRYNGDIEDISDAETIGIAGVDSGQMVIASADDFPTEREYDAVCRAHTKAGGLIHNGVVSTSGYGDGGYDVYVDREKGRGKISAVRVVFIRDEE